MSESNDAIVVESDDGGAPAPVAAPDVEFKINPELWKNRVEHYKAQIAKGDSPDGLQVVDTERSAASTEPATPAAPAKGPSPELVQAWERNNLRATELEKREKDLSGREERVRDISSAFMNDPYGTVKELLKMGLGDDVTESELQEEAAWQISQLSIALTGATIDPKDTDYTLSKIKRELRQSKAEKRQEVRRAQETSARASEQAKVQAAVAYISDAYKPMAEKYPYLTALMSSPADVIFDALREEYNRSGIELEIPEVASRLDAQLQEQYKKVRHLVTPQANKAETGNKATHQNDRPNRRSSALTTADASEDSASNGTPRSWDDHVHQAMARYKGQIQRNE